MIIWLIFNTNFPDKSNSQQHISFFYFHGKVWSDSDIPSGNAVGYILIQKETINKWDLNTKKN